MRHRRRPITHYNRATIVFKLTLLMDLGICDWHGVAWEVTGAKFNEQWFCPSAVSSAVAVPCRLMFRCFTARAHYFMLNLSSRNLISSYQMLTCLDKTKLLA